MPNSFENFFPSNPNPKKLEKIAIPDENDEKVNNKTEQAPIKVGVDLVFENNPDLAGIGSKEEYSTYLETIFPGSKEKDIVYHGTAAKTKIENFDFTKSNFAQAVFFTKDPDFAKMFAFDDGRDGSVQEQLLNIKNNFDFSDLQQVAELRELIRTLVSEGYSSYTGIKFENNLPKINIGSRVVENPTIEDFIDHYMWRLENGSWRIVETDRVIDFIAKKYDSLKIVERGQTNLAVFSPEQIHVLGSKKDLEGFKKFVGEKKP